MSITIEMFRTWEKDDVTKGMYKLLHDIKNQCYEYMTNPTVIRDTDCRTKLHEQLGMLQIIDMILTLETAFREGEIEDEDTANGS